MNASNFIVNNSHLTAIKRKGASAPLKFLASCHINAQQTVIDFGCGRGADLEWLRLNGYQANGYDPYWYLGSGALNKKYDVVLCTYVLNVIGNETREAVIGKLKSLVLPGGKIYITVRRDFKKDYVTKKGTRQYLVKLPYKKIKENSQYCIYEIKG